MKWDIHSIEKFLAAREYIDTALIPIAKLDMGPTCKQSVEKLNTQLKVAQYIEDQLQGRLMLFPVYTYVRQAGDSALTEQISLYTEYLLEHGFQYVVWLGAEEQRAEINNPAGEWLFLSEQNETDPTDEAVQIRSVAEEFLPNIMNLWKKG